MTHLHDISEKSEAGLQTSTGPTPRLTCSLMHLAGPRRRSVEQISLSRAAALNKVMMAETGSSACLLITDCMHGTQSAVLLPCTHVSPDGAPGCICNHCDDQGQGGAVMQDSLHNSRLQPSTAHM